MIKKIVKRLIPRSVLAWRERRMTEKVQRTFADRSVAETFSEIYAGNFWGGRDGEYYSGGGSDEGIAKEYAEMLSGFIENNGIRTVVDLGCGDFRVASMFISDDFHYIGCDVVQSLVEDLDRKCSRPNVEFRCVNVLTDELPDGDLGLFRQVLQHLSNAEIAQALQNAAKFKWLIVTEHYPEPAAPFKPNIDIPHGPGVRVPFGSAVVLDEPPFDRVMELLLDFECKDGTYIRSFLIRQ